MDWVKLKSSGMEAVKKYRYVLLVVLAGILLMALPESKEEQEKPEKTVEASQPCFSPYRPNSHKFRRRP